MFLKKSKKSYKGKGYETYALTESYREGGKVKHRHIANLGALTPEQASRIRLVLKAKRSEDVFVGPLSDVVAKQHYRFLDVAVLDQVWKRFSLDQFFRDLPYAEAMAVNRCLEPKAKIQIKKWTEQTVLPRLQEFESEDEFEIYRVLDQINEQEEALQKHLHQQYQRLGLAANDTVIYDLTSSYFEGTKCILASYGYSRDHRSDRKQVVIALVVTPRGYPLYWQVLPGNIQDVATVEELLAILKKRFDVKQCLLVFDRGMVSSNNLESISGAFFTYVSALDKDEIRTLGLIEPELAEYAAQGKSLLTLGFQTHDKNLFYREHLHQGRRYILAFNRNLYREQQQSRKTRLQKAKAYLSFYNEELGKAQKSRNEQTTHRKIEAKLRKWKLQKIISWQLEPLLLTVPTAKGGKRTVHSFQIRYEVNESRLQEQKQLDGILCFVTNNQSLSPEQIIGHYRRKDIIEDAFRELKSYLHLRPFYLPREERVKAHVSICVLGYLLFNALEDQLKQLERPLSGKTALELLKQCQLNRIGPHDSETYVESITELTDEQAALLGQLGLKHLVGKKYLNKILEHSAM